MGSHIWYVTFEVRRRGVLPERRDPRMTRTFATETEAQKFARSKLDEGLTIYAGTINPYSPRKLIPSHKILSWLKGSEEADGEGHELPGFSSTPDDESMRH